MKLNRINTVKFNGTDIDAVMLNNTRMYNAWTSVQAAVPLTLAESIGKPLKKLYIAGAEGGVGDLNEETGKYDIPLSVRGKNLLSVTNEKNYREDFANCSYEVIENGWRITGRSVSDQATAYSNGWFRPGYTDSGVRGVYAKKGDNLTVSADICAIKLSEKYANNNNMGMYLYTNSANVVSEVRWFSSNKTRRLSVSYKIPASGRWYPVFTINGNTIEITNVQVAKNETDITYEPYQNPTDLTLSLDAPIESGEGVYAAAQIPTVKGTTIIEANTATAPEYMAAQYKKAR